MGRNKRNGAWSSTSKWQSKFGRMGVAISKNGPLIIEGNRGPGFDLVQILLKKGTKYMLDDLLQEVKEGKLKEEKEKTVI